MNLKEKKQTFVIHYRFLVENNQTEIVLKLYDSKKLLAKSENKSETDRSDSFIFFVEEFLSQNKVNRRKINEIVVVDRGSSITGSRIINSSLQGLANALDKKIIFSLDDKN